MAKREEDSLMRRAGAATREVLTNRPLETASAIGRKLEGLARVSPQFGPAVRLARGAYEFGSGLMTPPKPAQGAAPVATPPPTTTPPPMAQDYGPESGTGAGPSPARTTYAPPVMDAPSVTPVAPRIMPYGSEAGTGQGPTPIGQTVPTALRPPIAEMPARTVGSESQTMTSPAALALQQSLNRRLRLAESNTMSGNRGGRVDINSVAGQRLAAQWDDAARSAFMNAMTPEQRTRFERDEAQQAIQRARMYEMTPGAIESKRASETARSVAASEAQGKLGATEAQRGQLALGKEQLTAESQRERDKLTTEARTKRELAEESRKSRELTALGDNLTKLYDSLSRIEFPDDNPTAKVIQSRIAALEKKQDDLLGMNAEMPQGGVTAQPAKQYTEGQRGEFNGQPYIFKNNKWMPA